MRFRDAPSTSVHHFLVMHVNDVAEYLCRPVGIFIFYQTLAILNLSSINLYIPHKRDPPLPVSPVTPVLSAVLSVK